MKTIIFKIKNLECSVCASDLDLNLEEIDGIEESSTNYAKQECIIKFNEEKITSENIMDYIKEKNNYEVILVDATI